MSRDVNDFWEMLKKYRFQTAFRKADIKKFLLTKIGSFGAHWKRWGAGHINTKMSLTSANFWTVGRGRM